MAMVLRTPGVCICARKCLCTQGGLTLGRHFLERGPSYCSDIGESSTEGNKAILLRGFCRLLLLHPRNPPLRRWPDSDLYCWSPLSSLPGNHSLSLVPHPCHPRSVLSRSQPLLQGSSSIPPPSHSPKRCRERGRSRMGERRRQRGTRERGAGKEGPEIAPLSRQIPTAPAFSFRSIPLSHVLSSCAVTSSSPTPLRFSSSSCLVDFRPGSGLTPVGADATTASAIRSAAIKLYPPPPPFLPSSLPADRDDPVRWKSNDASRNAEVCPSIARNYFFLTGLCFAIRETRFDD